MKNGYAIMMNHSHREFFILHSSFFINKKTMVKRILLSIVMLVLIAYLAVAITAFNRKPTDQTCRDMELVIKDTA